jgi:hypothetical protein
MRVVLDALYVITGTVLFHLFLLIQLKGIFKPLVRGGVETSADHSLLAKRRTAVTFFRILKGHNLERRIKPVSVSKVKYFDFGRTYLSDLVFFRRFCPTNLRNRVNAVAEPEVKLFDRSLSLRCWFKKILHSSTLL